MKEILLFLLGISLPTAFGLFTWRFDVVRRLDLGARLAIAFAAGMVVIATVMFAFSVTGVPWKRTTLVPVMLIAAAAGVILSRTSGEGPRASASGSFASLRMTVVLAVTGALAIYGTATARLTCADLLYFWGPKAQRFHDAGAIDATFLGVDHHFLMHADYPPLQPLVWAWGALASHGFSWWGALLTTPLLVIAPALAFRGLAKSNLYAGLLASVLLLGIVAPDSGGGADPTLYLFELIALAALTFHPRDRGAQCLAAIALGGAVFTKVEGLAFAVVVLAIYLVLHRDWRATLAMAVPPALLLGGWLLFVRHHQLWDTYAKDGTLHFANLGTVLSLTARKVGYGSFYLPWIAAAVPFAFGANWRRARFPLLVAAATFTYTIYFYLHEAEPLLLILTSAERVLLTTVIALVVAAAAASRDGVLESRADGVVPQREEAEGSGREADRDPRGPLDQV
jgi:hypothetical protein